MAYKHLYLPVEIKSREFDAKLLLACVAAENDFTAIIGRRDRILARMKSFPKGVIIEKGIESPSKLAAIQNCKYHGHKVVAWDEEGLIFGDSKIYLNRRIHPEALAKLSLFLTWGSKQTETIIGKFPEYKDRIVATGNPRIDLLREELRSIYNKQVSKLHARYGSFFLVNSNFSIVNPIETSELLLKKLRLQGYLHNSQMESEFHERAEKWTRKLEEFFLLMPRLSEAFPDLTIIVRPHPSENSTAWSNQVSNLPNTTSAVQSYSPPKPPDH